MPDLSDPLDDLTLLRELDADVEPPESLTLLRARRRLLAAAVPRRRRRRLRVAVGVAAVGVVSAGVLVAPTWWHHDGRVAASAEAVEVLQRAAAVSLATSDPVVRPGQYLAINTHAVTLNGGGAANTPPAYWSGDKTSTLFIPGERSDDWVLDQQPLTHVTTLLGDPPPPAARDYHEDVLRAADGDFFGNGEPSWQAPDAAFMAALPRDPGNLLARLRDDSAGHGATPDDEALRYIADLLRNGRVPVPADLRAALFEAAQRIPGLAVVDDAANLDGRSGIAIARTEPVNGLTDELVFDTRTGEFIGERLVSARDDGGLPAGTVYSSTAVTTRVVDADQVP